jgi:hypothetical protein
MAPVIQSRTSTYSPSSCATARSALSWLAKTPDLISNLADSPLAGSPSAQWPRDEPIEWNLDNDTYYCNIHKPAQREKLLRLSSDRSSLYSLNQGIEIGGLLNRSNGAGFVPCLYQKIEKPGICLGTPPTAIACRCAPPS